MAMYHSWDSQRRLAAPDPRPQPAARASRHRERGRRASKTAPGAGSKAPWGRVRCMARHSQAVEPGTVWTWNAIGKADGAWQLAPGADEARKGFLLNHLISEELPCPGSPSGASATRTRSPARPAGTTCACASARPSPMPQPDELAAGEASATPPAGRRRRGAAPYFAKGASMIQWALGTWQAGVVRRRAPAWHRRPTPAPAARASPARRWRASSRWSSTSTSASAAMPASPPAAVEHLRRGRPAGRRRRLRRRAPAAPSSTACRATRPATTRHADRALPKSCLHCEDPPCVPVCSPPARATSAPRTASCWSTTTSASAASTAPGPALRRARELDEARQVMTKCTLCVDRIHDPAAPWLTASRPASRPARPAHACSATSRTRSPRCRAGHPRARRLSLMPEWDTRPANHYLPRRITPAGHRSHR